MSASPSGGGPLRFGRFTLEPQRAELQKDGKPVKIQPQPFRVLALLAGRAGEVVSREEIKEELWSGDTFVDFEHGINYCINQIRTALGDDPEKPQFVQTVPRKGYRFLASVDAAAAPASETARPIRGKESKDGHRSRVFAVAVVAAVSSLAGGLLVWNLLRSNPSAPGGALTHFVVTLPPDQKLAYGPSTPMALSPDGRHLVYVANRGGSVQLYHRAADAFEAKPLPGTEGAHGPFFSPNGQWVGFFADDTLQKVSVRGGAPLKICDAAIDNPGASWSSNDTIIFSSRSRTSAGRPGLVRVSAEGGAPEPLTTPGIGETWHGLPQSLPDGKGVLFTISTSESTRVGVLSLESGEWRTLREAGEARAAWYVPTGHLVYARPGRLFAAPFDVSRLELSGTPVPVLEGLYGRHFQSFDVPYFAFSNTGSLVYVPGGATTVRSALVWVDRDGRETELREDLGRYRFPRLSPDGRRVAVLRIMEGGKRDIWILDLDRDTQTRLTFGGGLIPIWTPNGQRIAFSSIRSGVLNLYWKRADGSGEAERLLTSEHREAPESFTPDGQVLAFMQIHPESRSDIWLLPLEGDRKPEPFLVTPFHEFLARFSPNGRWVAYSGRESSREKQEIYVRPYPKAEADKVHISSDGGGEPVWSADGRELFYRNGDQMLAVAVVATGATLTAGKPQVLFEGRYDVTSFNRQNYDVSRDGRFLMVKTKESPPTQMNVVLNWFDELTRLVPTHN